MLKENIMEILNHLTKNSDFPNTMPIKCTAQVVADKLGVKRNTASRYLNQLTEEGQLIKINTRPVQFIPKQMVEELLETEIEQNEFESYESLKGFDQTSVERRIFSNLVGFDKSLYGIVEQSIAAMKYPDGLPILFFGNSGVGKSMLANKIYEYCKAIGTLTNDAPFIELNCAQYFNNPELLTSQLFGYVKGAFTGADGDHKGIIENADRGIVFLDEVHRLSPEGQEKLFLHMDKGVFKRIGDNGPWRKSKVRYIFATTEKQNSTLLTTFIRRIPIICTLPDYSERSKEERKAILFHLFEQEAELIQKDIMVTETALDFLLKLNPPGNIGEIAGLIKQTVAGKLSKHSSNNYIEIRVLDFPERYLKLRSKSSFSTIEGRKTYIFSEEKYVHFEEGKSSFQEKRDRFFLKVSQLFSHQSDSKTSPKGLKNMLQSYLEDFCDNYTFRENNEVMTKFFLPELQNIFQNIDSNIFFSVKGNTLQMIAAYLYNRNNWIDKENIPIEEVKQIESMLIREMGIQTSMIFNLLENTLDIQLSLWDKLFIELCFFNESSEDKAKERAIILAHGYATASSIANVANRMVQQHIFDSIDMPLNIPVKEIVSKLNNYIDTYKPQNGLLILVDMGSLEEIRQDIEHTIQTPSVIINNVSTSMALNVATKIVQGYSIEDLAKIIPEESKIDSQILLPMTKKPKTIIVSCNTGLGTAMKLKEMFEEFLPPGIDVQFISYETETLKSIQKEGLVFQSNDVIAIIGTDDPDIDGIPFVSLEELFRGEQGQLYSLFRELYGEEVAKEVDGKIVKNLTLDRLIDSLTILDAEKVVEQIDVCFEKIEGFYKEKISTSKKIGLYVHLSCMIERLIRNQGITSFPELETFVKENRTSMERLRHSLENLEKLYNIAVSDAELAYVLNMLLSE